MRKQSLRVIRGGQAPLPPTAPSSESVEAASPLPLEEQATALLDQVLYGDWDSHYAAWQAMFGQGGIPEAAERLKQAWRWELEQIVKRLRKTPESFVLLHLALLGLELVRWQQLVIESGWSPDGQAIQKPQIVPAGLVIEEQALAELRGKRDAAIPAPAEEEEH